MIEVPGSGGDGEQVLFRLDGMQRESFFVLWPHIFVGLRIAANTKSVRRLDEDVALIPDPLDDIAEDLDVAGRSLVGGPRMDVNDRRACLVALVRCFSDFGRRDWHVRTIPVLLRTSVDRGKNDEFFSGSQSHLPIVLNCLA